MLAGWRMVLFACDLDDHVASPLSQERGVLGWHSTCSDVAMRSCLGLAAFFASSWLVLSGCSGTQGQPETTPGTDGGAQTEDATSSVTIGVSAPETTLVAQGGSRTIVVRLARPAGVDGEIVLASEDRSRIRVPSIRIAAGADSAVVALEALPSAELTGHPEDVSLVGTVGGRAATARLSVRVTPPSASIDKGFGTSGVYEVPNAQWVNQVASGPDGRLAFLGAFSVVPGQATELRVALADAKGSADSNQLVALEYTCNRAELGETANDDLVFEPDGKLTVAQRCISYSSGQTYLNNVLLVSRYEPSGKLDPSFGSKGVVVLSALRDGAFREARLTHAGDGSLLVYAIRDISHYYPNGRDRGRAVVVSVAKDGKAVTTLETPNKEGVRALALVPAPAPSTYRVLTVGDAWLESILVDSKTGKATRICEGAAQIGESEATLVPTGAALAVGARTISAISPECSVSSSERPAVPAIGDPTLLLGRGYDRPVLVQRGAEGWEAVYLGGDGKPTSVRQRLPFDVSRTAAGPYSAVIRDLPDGRWMVATYDETADGVLVSRFWP